MCLVHHPPRHGTACCHSCSRTHQTTNNFYIHLDYNKFLLSFPSASLRHSLLPLTSHRCQLCHRCHHHTHTHYTPSSFFLAVLHFISFSFNLYSVFFYSAVVMPCRHFDFYQRLPHAHIVADTQIEIICPRAEDTRIFTFLQTH